MSWVTKRIVLARLSWRREELVLEAVADDGVDRAERLVHEQDRRVGGQGARDADALPLAAGELARVAVAVARRVEPDEVEELVGALAAPRLRPAQQARHGGDVLSRRSGAGRGRPAG